MDIESRMASAETEDLRTILETENLSNLIMKNSFLTTTASGGIRQKENEKKQLALWTLPSLINHSCVPNLIYNVLGHNQHRIMVIRSIADIHKGDELTISYSSIRNNEDRKNFLSEAYKFECKCINCMKW